MIKYRISSIFLILALIGLSFFLQSSQKAGARFPFKFGLDLVGGTELIYKADISKVAPGDVATSMDALRDVIERRVNVFGVSEPIIQVEEAGLISGNKDERLIVELPGVTDIDKAIALIGQTPLLEFKLQKVDFSKLSKEQIASSSPDELFATTALTGRLLSKAQLQFDPTSHLPVVMLNFNDEGRDLFAKITRENTGKVLGIFLDGKAISLPVIREEIGNGSAQITGGDRKSVV